MSVLPTYSKSIFKDFLSIYKTREIGTFPISFGIFSANFSAKRCTTFISLSNLNHVQELN